MDTLGLDLSDLVTFVDNIQAADIVVPFDANSNFGDKTLLSLSLGTGSFPPAISCYPGSELSQSQIDTINSLEASAFGLDSISSSNTGDTNCTSRPLYGILNILNLRQPFVEDDSRPTLPRQAIVLEKAVQSRVTVHAGEVLVGLLAGSPNGTLSSQFSSPNDFGIFNHLSSILFSYLSLMSVDTAKALANFVVANTGSPPDGSLLAAINSIPILEVSVWGGIKDSDINFAMSSISSSGSLFFGSANGNVFRNITTNLEVDWSKSSTDLQFAREPGKTNSKFEAIWKSAATASDEDAIFTSLDQAGFVVEK
ncbi:hypothetical protein BT69DRAFT_81625 [Atractiella rhizophila]|nr:hypothetical protein BT69DRAFT_81625 [Atractiella rhizophila]